MIPTVWVLVLAAVLFALGAAADSFLLLRLSEPVTLDALFPSADSNSMPPPGSMTKA